MKDTTIHCMAIDDEPVALSIIEKFCDRLGGIRLSTYSDPRLGLEAVRMTKPDVLLLDIEMNDITGLSIAKEVGRDTAVIFTTAYLQYALDGYDLDVVDFLHKPFSFDRFKIAMEKAVRRMNFIIRSAAMSITVKQEYANINVRLTDIEYIEAMENYAKIYKLSGECIISHTSMKGLMEMLPTGLFIRTHRSYIISARQVRNFTRQEIRLNSGKILPVGRQYADSVINLLGINK